MSWLYGLPAHTLHLPAAPHLPSPGNTSAATSRWRWLGAVTWRAKRRSSWPATPQRCTSCSATTTWRCALMQRGQQGTRGAGLGGCCLLLPDGELHNWLLLSLTPAARLAQETWNPPLFQPHPALTRGLPPPCPLLPPTRGLPPPCPHTLLPPPPTPRTGAVVQGDGSARGEPPQGGSPVQPRVPGGVRRRGRHPE